MKIRCFAVFDDKARIYQTPWFAQTDGMAKRMFGDGVQLDDTPLNKHPGDYKLYEIGHFEMESGILIGMETAPVFLAHGSDFVKPAHLLEVERARA